MNQQEWKKNISEVLKLKLDPEYVLLFGSFAKGTERKDSDMDIAYSSSKRLSDYERFMLSQELASVLKRDVDLIDLHKIDTVFANQIYYYGELLDCKNEGAFIKDRMKTLSMYVALNEQRADVIRNIEESGRIYDE